MARGTSDAMWRCFILATDVKISRSKTLPETAHEPRAGSSERIGVVEVAFIVENWYPGFERLPIGLGDPNVGGS